MEPRFSVDGHRLQIDLSAMIMAEVEIILPDGKRLLYTFDAPSTPDLALDSLVGLVSAFLTYKEIDENRRRTTLTDYQRRLGLFAAWLADQGRDPMQASDWRGYYASLKARGLAALSIRNHYRCLSIFADWLVNRGVIPVNPLAGITPPKPTKNQLPKAISFADIRSMLSAASSIRDRALLLFFWDTGCRAGEAASLRWGDVHPGEGTAYVTGKGDKARLLAFTPEITGKLLLGYRETVPHRKNDPVWWGKAGPLTYSGIYQIFKRAAKKAEGDSNFNPHAWRHAFGRDATVNGMPTGILQRVLGHEDIETTKIYLGFSQEDIREAHRRYSPVGKIDLDDLL